MHAQFTHNAKHGEGHTDSLPGTQSEAANSAEPVTADGVGDDLNDNSPDYMWSVRTTNGG